MGTAGKLHTQGIEPCTIPRYVDTSPALYSSRENSEATTVWVCGNWQMRHYAVFQQRGKHGCSTTVACALGQEDLQVAADGTAAHGTLVLPALHNLDGANSAHCHMAAWIQARLHGGFHTDHGLVLGNRHAFSTDVCGSGLRTRVLADVARCTAHNDWSIPAAVASLTWKVSTPSRFAPSIFCIVSHTDVSTRFT